MGITLRPYQQQVYNDILQAWGQGAQVVCAVLPTGAGKCLGKDTPVLMFDGKIKKVQDVKTGDLLMGPDSKHRRVLSICRGFEPLYKVTPVKGDPYVVNESHILSLKQTGLKSKPKYNCQRGKNTVVNISVRKYLNKSKYFKHIHKGWRVGVDWNGEIKDKYLPPYLLGLWLGDGSSRMATITTADVEIENYLFDFTYKNNLPIRIEKNPGSNKSKNYHILSGGRHRNSVKHSLKFNNLIQNKHVPLKYKTASRQHRRELLAGLIDSDGSMSRNGYDITFKNQILAEDTAFIARSLGLAAYVNRCEKTCTNNGKTKEYHRISISGDCGMIPVKIGRKKAPKRRQIKSVLVTGIKVKKHGYGKYYGFEIDGDGLFLLGDFTVTHNTVVFTHAVSQTQGVVFSIAHRQELVCQISMAHARAGIEHCIQAPENVVKYIIQCQIREFSRHYVRPDAQRIVCSVQTLLSRASTLSNAIGLARLWVGDEFHHFLRDNQWGKAVAMFPPSCRGLGVTATPGRADGLGLGRHADGVADSLVVGPNMRQLISAGYLSDYRVFGPYSSIDLSNVTVGSTGDYSRPKLTAAVRKSHIVGDVVGSYLKIASGLTGVTFVTDVKTGQEIAQAYTAAGVPARVVHAKTPDKERQESTAMLARGDLKQLTNVDIFGEGYDLPAIETISMARPTASYPLYAQQFGRALRTMDGKSHALIIDHVRNVERHGLPDRGRTLTLDRRNKRGSRRDPELIPIRTCLGCTAVYESWLKTCPHCGHSHKVNEVCRSIEQVEGDIVEIDPETLNKMRGEIARIDAPAAAVGDKLRHAGAGQAAVAGAMANHRKRQDAQAGLRDCISLWAGYQRAAGGTDSVIMKRFYRTFGMDVLTAQTLGRRDAEELKDRVHRSIF